VCLRCFSWANVRAPQPRAPCYTAAVTRSNMLIITAHIPLVASRHDTKRYLAHAFWHKRKSWRGLSRLSGSTARHARHDKRDSHDTCSGTSPQRGLGKTCSPHFFQKLFLRLMQIQSTKDKTCTHKHCCFFVVRHFGTSTARHARQARPERHVVRVVSRRVVTQQVEFGQIITTIQFNIAPLAEFQRRWKSKSVKRKGNSY